ncbi:hypothetical protein ACS0TY_030219 [Phlomoides rotata]
MVDVSRYCQLRHISALFIATVVLLLPTGIVTVADKDSRPIISRFQEYLRINTAQPKPSYYEASNFITSQAKALSLDYQILEFDMKCVGLQYLEAIRKLQAPGFRPLRTVYLSFLPDEEIGGHDGVEKFSVSDIFKSMNVGIVLDEGLASPTEKYRVFYGERGPWWLVIKATCAPGHGAKLYDNTAMENLLKSIESISRFRASQFDLTKSGLKAEGEVISVNMVFLKAGTPSSTGFVMNLQPSEAEAGFDGDSLERRIAEEWAPVTRNMTFQLGQFKQRAPRHDKYGNPLVTTADSSNPWWGLLEEAIKNAGGKLEKPEIFPAATDSRYFRECGLPAIDFSPMVNTPILLHDHNEFLNKVEYLRGIEMYESIIKAYAYYVEPTTKDESSREEL